jgi:hypothetical protein
MRSGGRAGLGVEPGVGPGTGPVRGWLLNRESEGLSATTAIERISCSLR